MMTTLELLSRQDGSDAVRSTETSEAPSVAADPFAPVVIARAGGLRAVRPGLRSRRYRQGV